MTGDGLEGRSGKSEERIFIDKQSPKAFRAMRQAAEAVRETAKEAGIDRSLVELIDVRVSQMNRCAYCLDRHTRAALRGGESPQRLAVLPAWRDTEVFTPVERAALALAEATTDPVDGELQESAYAAARKLLTDDQISAVVWVAITINAFNRVSILSKHRVLAEGQAL